MTTQRYVVSLEPGAWLSRRWTDGPRSFVTNDADLSAIFTTSEDAASSLSQVRRFGLWPAAVVRLRVEMRDE